MRGVSHDPREPGRLPSPDASGPRSVADARRLRALRKGTVMAPVERREGQAALFAGMVGCAASVVLRRFDLDFLSGVALGMSLGLFFLGFRAFYRR
jgi:hypothetical protein